MWGIISILIFGVVVGTVAALVVRKRANPAARFFLAFGGAIVGGLASSLVFSPHRFDITPPLTHALPGALVGALLLALSPLGSAPANDDTVSRPIGHTNTGEPIYPVVGYTPDGKPVTADRVAGPLVGGYNSRTNSMAIAALVLGIVAGPLAIPFGHIARSQIARTGEQGGGMALAGLILGYIGLVSLIGLVILFAGAANSLASY